jgi:hypothetical protein
MPILYILLLIFSLPCFSCFGKSKKLPEVNDWFIETHDLSSDNKFLLANYIGGSYPIRFKTCLFDLKTGKKIHTFLYPEKEDIFHSSYSKFSNSGNYLFLIRTSNTELWSTSPLKKIKTIKEEIIWSDVRSDNKTYLSPDDKYFCTLSENKTINIRSKIDGEVIQEINFLANQKMLSNTLNEKLDFTNNEILNELTIKFSKNSEFLVTVFNRFKTDVNVWNIKSGKKLPVLNREKEQVYYPDFHEFDPSERLSGPRDLEIIFDSLNNPIIVNLTNFTVANYNLQNNHWTISKIPLNLLSLPYPRARLFGNYLTILNYYKDEPRKTNLLVYDVFTMKSLNPIFQIDSIKEKKLNEIERIERIEKENKAEWDKEEIDTMKKIEVEYDGKIASTSNYDEKIKLRIKFESEANLVRETLQTNRISKFGNLNKTLFFEIFYYKNPLEPFILLAFDCLSQNLFANDKFKSTDLICDVAFKGYHTFKLSPKENSFCLLNKNNLYSFDLKSFNQKGFIDLNKYIKKDSGLEFMYTKDSKYILVSIKKNITSDFVLLNANDLNVVGNYSISPD